MIPSIGIVVPTLGQRPEYLRDCLKSIRSAGEAYVLFVAPESFDFKPYILAGLADQFELDPGLGLAEAINAGIAALPQEVALVNWLGDDDLLTANSLTSTAEVLNRQSDVDLVFGSCDYIDANGTKIWRNKSGQWAVPLLRIGPDLIPQPGALFRRSFFNKVGGANPSFGLAFDFELLIRMSRQGKLKFLNKTLSAFRWHPESLSVELRRQSVMDASKSRTSHLPSWLRPVSVIWETPLRLATLWAGSRITRKAKAASLD
jgi:GT2 family glycosyltransferase